MNLTKQEKRELKRKQKEEKMNRAVRRRKLKRIAIWAGVLGLVVFVIGLFIYFAGKTPNIGDYSLDTVLDFEQTKGNKDADVVLIEYSDFECPACGFYYAILKQLTEEFGDEMLFVYRHFPLAQYANSELAAIASEAAGRQGTFWEMHDMIFEGRHEWSGNTNAEEVFVSYAEELGLDTSIFENDLEDGEIIAKVRSDLRSGTRAKVTGTPTFFLNGERISPPNNYEGFRDLIIETLEAN